MKAPSSETDWFDHLVATLFAAVAVLGVVTVVVTMILFFPGSPGSDLPLP